MRAPSTQGFECRYGSVNSGFAMSAYGGIVLQNSLLRCERAIIESK